MFIAYCLRLKEHSNERLAEVKETYSKNLLIKEILSFLSKSSNRPLVHPKLDKF